MVTKETAKEFLNKCIEENISPGFAFTMIDILGPKYCLDDYKILSIDECKEWAKTTIYSFSEITSYFLKKSDFDKL